jgi:hypothetical protein
MSDVWANDNKEPNAVVAGDGSGGFGTGSHHNVFAVSFKDREQSRAGRGAYGEHGRPAMAAFVSFRAMLADRSSAAEKFCSSEWGLAGVTEVVENRPPSAAEAFQATPAKAASTEIGASPSTPLTRGTWARRSHR